MRLLMNPVGLTGLFALALLTGDALASGADVEPSASYTPEQYRSDFEFMVQELEVRHPDPFQVLPKAQFEAQLDQLATKSSTQDAFTTMMDLRVLVAGLGDSHTSVGFYDDLFARGAFPLEFSWFGDDLYVIGAEEAYKELLGARLDEIESVPTQTISEQLSTLVPPRDLGFARKRIPWMLPYIGVHHYFKTAEGSSARFSFTGLGGETIERNVEASLFGGESGDLEYLSDKLEHPTWINPNEDRLDIMFRDILFEDGVYLVQYNSCWGRELEARFGDPAAADGYPSFAEFQDRILTTLATNDVKALIFDVRANSGGSSPQGTELARQIAALPSEQKPSSVFVAISDQTFSSAIINAMDFKQILGAEFVGTQTGGKANHFGEVRLFELPNSGIELPHSTRYFEYVDGEGGSLAPDIYAPVDIDDLRNRRDTAVEAVRMRISG